MVLVQEALCGDLLRFMYRKYGGRLPERVAVSLVLLPLLSALSHLHSEVGAWDSMDTWGARTSSCRNQGSPDCRHDQQQPGVS